MVLLPFGFNKINRTTKYLPQKIIYQNLCTKVLSVLCLWYIYHSCVSNKKHTLHRVAVLIEKIHINYSRLAISKNHFCSAIRGHLILNVYLYFCNYKCVKASAVLSTTAAASVILFVILQPTKYWKTLQKLATAFISSNASYYLLLLLLLLLPSRNSWPKHVTGV